MLEYQELSVPLVSTVIPTRNRPELVCRAVRCALNQTHPHLEVVVVIDGPDPETFAAVEALNLGRVRIVPLSQSVGGSEARNRGVQEAAGEWVAFLDDDDEWLPDKIEKQMTVALTLAAPLAFIACKFVDRGRYGDRVLPAVAADLRLPFSEYLLCRTGLTGGTGYVQTSTWLVSRELAQRCKFTKGLRRNQDLDWMLRAMSLPGAIFALVNEPLSILNSEQGLGRVSKVADWRFHYDWAMSNREWFTKRALTFFLSTVCVEDATRQRQRIAASKQLIAAIQAHGKPSFKSWLFFFYYLLVTEALRLRIRAAIVTLRKIASADSICESLS
jgi:glycosyltransferase involved in cell wall biosynthesis